MVGENEEMGKRMGRWWKRASHMLALGSPSASAGDRLTVADRVLPGRVWVTVRVVGGRERVLEECE